MPSDSAAFSELWRYANLENFIATHELRLPSVSEAIARSTFDPLTPAEALHVQEAVDKRQVEFRAGRHCARRALRCLGLPGDEILVHANRAPAWPGGVVGSITHCAGLVAAAVAHAHEVLALGIDAEAADELAPELWSMIATPLEVGWLQQLDQQAAPGKIAKLLFSAKESFFKGQFPLTQQMIDFHAVECPDVLHLAAIGSFRLRVRQALAPWCGPRHQVDVVFSITPAFIRTAMCVRR